MAYKEPEVQKQKPQEFSQLPKAEKTALDTLSLIPKRSESSITFTGSQAQEIARQMAELYKGLDPHIKMAKAEQKV